MDDWLGDFSLNISDGWDSFGPTFDAADYSTSVFDDPNWFTSTDWSTPSYDYSTSVFDNPDWFSLSNTDFLGDYDPLTDVDASILDITNYLDKYLSDPDLYSLLGGGDYGLSEGSVSDLALSDSNILGKLLSENPVALEESSNNPISKLLGMLTKGAGVVQGATRSPLGQLAMALATALAKRKGISSFNKRNEDTASNAKATSQRGLGSNRTGLANMNTTQRAPETYVQPAPMITRNT